jgi:4-amino-4-deoxychorismate lyase
MILVNGTIGDTVSASDRGLMYGDGVFRTLRIHGGLPYQWERHYQKLHKDCERLAIRCPDKAVLTAELAQIGTVDADCVAKIIVTRGLSQRGYAIAPGPVTRIVQSSPLPSHPMAFQEEGVRVRICDIRLAEQPRLAGIKHLNRLENVLARMEWNDPDIPEGLMLDGAGHVVEGIMTNLFARIGDILHTPDLDRCGVAGVQRDLIMEQASQWGLSIRISNLSVEFLKKADEVVLCNSIIGAWQVRELEERPWHPGSLAKKIRMATLP